MTKLARVSVDAGNGLGWLIPVEEGKHGVLLCRAVIAELS